MTEQRTYQGATYERSGPGQPWALVGGAAPTSGAPAPTSVMVPRVTPANPGYRATPEGGEAPIHGGPADPTRPGGPMDPENQLSQDAIDQQADNYLMTQTLPPLGMGGASGARQHILNRAAEMARAAGQGRGDLAAQVAAYRARRQALQSQETQLANLRSMEPTASLNLAALSQAAHALPGQTEMPLINRLTRSVQRNYDVTGHKEVGPYDLAYQTAINEYARLISMGSSGNGQLTDAAREEAERTIPYGSSPAQIDADIAQAHIDMRNRITSYQATVDRLRAELTGRPAPQHTAPDGPGPVGAALNTASDQIWPQQSGTTAPGAAPPSSALSPGAPPDHNAPPGTPPPDGEGLVVDVWPGGPPPHDRSQANAAWQNAFQRASAREPGLTWDAFIARNLAPIGQQAPPGQALVTTPPRQGLFGPTSPSLDNSYLGQGLSGINEGIANTLGAPVDLVNSLYGAGLHGINAIANTDFQPSQEPFLGSAQFRRLLGATGSIATPTDNPGQQFVRRTAQSVGGALIPVAATAGTMARAGTGMMTALGGGMGAATAQQVAPGNPYVELGGEVLGSLGSAGGMFGLARRSARQAAEAAVPTVPQLRQQAGNLYTAAESRGIVAGPSVTRNIASRIRTIARDEELVTPTGRVSTAYPRAAEAMNLMNDYGGAHMTPRQIQVIRETLGDAVGGTQGKERRIASMMLHAFDEETVPLAPELAQARDIASRYLQANQVQRAIDLAEPRAAQYSQSGSQNALRTEFRNLDRRMINGQAQFTPAVAAAIERVSRGDVSTNIMRNVGRLAPTGTVSTGLSAGVPFLIGNAMGGPAVGAAASAGTMALGTAARAGANRATVNQARMAEMLARNGGEINSVDPDVAYRIAMALMSPALAASHPPY